MEICKYIIKCNTLNAELLSGRKQAFFCSVLWATTSAVTIINSIHLFYGKEQLGSRQDWLSADNAYIYSHGQMFTCK